MDLKVWFIIAGSAAYSWRVQKVTPSVGSTTVALKSPQRLSVPVPPKVVPVL
jgi:hypothetical protein